MEAKLGTTGSNSMNTEQVTAGATQWQSAKQTTAVLRCSRVFTMLLLLSYLSGMSVLCEHAIATYFAYYHIFRILSAHISYFFPHRLVFLMAIIILFVFLLPISIRFRYLDHGTSASRDENGQVDMWR